MSRIEHWPQWWKLSSLSAASSRRMPAALCVSILAVAGMASGVQTALAAESAAGLQGASDRRADRQAVSVGKVDLNGFIEIATGHYLHAGVHEDFTPANDGAIANIGFIVGTESVVVIDPGSSVTSARRLQDAIGKVTDLPVSHVVLSHYHPDHVFGSFVFAEAPNIVAHKNYPRAQLQRGQFYRERFAYLLAGASADMPEAVPDVLVAVGTPLIIDPGGRRLEISAWPVAHTDNDLTVFDDSTGTLWASDLVFHERVPSLDGSLRGWIDVMASLQRAAPDLVVPGHGPPGSWNEVTRAQERYLDALLEQTRAAIGAGSSLAEAVKSVGRDEAGQWATFELNHSRNVSRAYTELEWE